jgi:hypothetical protein
MPLAAPIFVASPEPIVAASASHIRNTGCDSRNGSLQSLSAASGIKCWISLLGHAPTMREQDGVLQEPSSFSSTKGEHAYGITHHQSCNLR